MVGGPINDEEVSITEGDNLNLKHPCRMGTLNVSEATTLRDLSLFIRSLVP